MNAPAFRFQPLDPHYAERCRASFGRLLTIARGDVYARKAADTVHVATVQQTLMMLPDTPDSPE